MYSKIVFDFRYIISLEPKDPHLIVKCAKMLITLPFMVRDFKLGKQYLNKAVQMAPNDITVLNAVTETVELYKKMVNYIFLNINYNILINSFFFFLINNYIFIY